MSNEAWPLVPLASLLTRNEKLVTLIPDQQYREVTIRLWGKGVFLRQIVNGADIASQRRSQVTRDQFIVSRIDARNGAMGLVPAELDGAVVTNDFPTFNVNRTMLMPEFLGWLCRTQSIVDKCRSASEGTTNRVRLKEERFMKLEIELPPIREQMRIVCRIDSLVSKVQEAQALADKSNLLTNGFLNSFFHRISLNAPKRPLNEVAPLVRRLTVVQVSDEYPQVSVRSFGKGTFHNPPLRGSEITWQKPFRVHCGDILSSNIKAWEGAIAVAGPMDHGRFGSHRYLTFVPKLELVTAQYLCFYLLSPEGLFHVGESSPGSADRNRTLSAKKLLDIRIPLPPLPMQQQFDSLSAKVLHAREIRAKTNDALIAMLPSILDSAFKGAL